MSLPEKFAEWKSIDRTEIDWAPEVDKDQCTGCGMCVTSCGRNVFDYDWKQEKAVVARPNQCMVGCTSCQTWCIYDAISFPEPEYVKNIIKDKKVISLAKEQLEERKEN